MLGKNYALKTLLIPTNKEYVHEINIWNNRFIKDRLRNQAFTHHGTKKGVMKIGHPLDENNRSLSRSDFQQKYCLSVNFLMYNGRLAAIPAAWKKAILNSEQHLKNNNNNSIDLTAAKVTAKRARKQLVLSSLKAPNIVNELVEKHPSHWIFKKHFDF